MVTYDNPEKDFAIHNTMFLIIDLQKDFASKDGTLSVNDGGDADNIKKFLFEYGKFFNSIVTTQDLHPRDHCSFIENGGKFNPHCVRGSEGSNLYLIDGYLNNSEVDVFSFYKGTDKKSDEFSFLKNKKNRRCFANLVMERNVREIVVCGEALDFCVCSTILDLVEVYRIEKVILLSDFTSPAIRGNEQGILHMLNFIKNVEVTTSAEFISSRDVRNSNLFLESKMNIELIEKDVHRIKEKFEDFVFEMVSNKKNPRNNMKEIKNLFSKVEEIYNFLKWNEKSFLFHDEECHQSYQKGLDYRLKHDKPTKELSRNYQHNCEVQNEIFTSVNDLKIDLHILREKMYFDLCQISIDDFVTDQFAKDLIVKNLQTISKNQPMRYFNALKKFNHKILNIKELSLNLKNSQPTVGDDR